MHDNILRKIKGCLALASSSNPNEAAAAVQRAQALMAKYGLTREDVAASDVSARSTLAGCGKTPPAHIIRLCRMINDAFGTAFVYAPEWDFSGWRWVGRVEFYGVGSAPEIAGYTYEVLERQLRRDRLKYVSTLPKRLKRETKVRRGDLYAQGWVHAVRSKVTPRYVSEQEEMALAAYKDQRWQGSLESFSGRNTAIKGRVHDLGALSAGLADGKQVSLHQGVTGDSAGPLGLE